MSQVPAFIEPFKNVSIVPICDPQQARSGMGVTDVKYYVTNTIDGRTMQNVYLFEFNIAHHCLLDCLDIHDQPLLPGQRTFSNLAKHSISGAIENPGGSGRFNTVHAI